MGGRPANVERTTVQRGERSHLFIAELSTELVKQDLVSDYVRADHRLGCITLKESRRISEELLWPLSLH